MKTILLPLSILALFAITPAGFSLEEISKETAISWNRQTEVFSNGKSGKALQCNLGATPGRVMIVRLYECDPAGIAPKVVKQFEQKSGNLWWNKPGAIKKSWGRLKLGTGIRYVMTVEPKGGLKTQITYNNVSAQTPKILGNGRTYPTFDKDPLRAPYATGRASTAAAFRLPSNVTLHDD